MAGDANSVAETKTRSALRWHRAMLIARCGLNSGGEEGCALTGYIARFVCGGVEGGPWDSGEVRMGGNGQVWSRRGCGKWRDGRVVLAAGIVRMLRFSGRQSHFWRLPGARRGGDSEWMAV